jgi:hypothetical protein
MPWQRLWQQLLDWGSDPMTERRISLEDHRLLDEMRQRGGIARISEGRPRHGADRLVEAGFATSRALNMSDVEYEITPLGREALVLRDHGITSVDIESIEPHRFDVDGLWYVKVSCPGDPAVMMQVIPMFGPTNWNTKYQYFVDARNRVIAHLNAAIGRLQEKLSDSDEDAGGRLLRAYQGLDLHPEIARAASQLYNDGHYSNAVEDAVKALNGLVRMRSGIQEDGVPLSRHLDRRHERRTELSDPARCCLLGIAIAAQVTSRSAPERSATFNDRRLGFGCGASVASITRRSRARQQSFAGGRCIKRHASPAHALYVMRQQGRDPAASRLGRHVDRFSAISGNRHLD